MSLRRLGGAAVVVILLIAGWHERVLAFPVDGDQTALPAKTELNEDALSRPREVFHSEINGRKSDLIRSGQPRFRLAVDPRQRGAAGRHQLRNLPRQRRRQRQALHADMSTRPGNFDTTGPLFNPKADNGVLDPVRIPSLRGARYLAPYGADGRIASLRDFVRNVIVNEFAGPEPSPVHARCHRRLYPGYRFPARTQVSVRRAGWSEGSANRSAAVKRCSQSRSRMIPA